MFKNKTVAAVIPCYNEELLISRTISEIPEFVDVIFAVNDCSTDNTKQEILRIAKSNPKVRLIDLEVNQGVGGAVIAGYQEVIATTDAYYVGLVAGDAQFPSSHLTAMIEELDAKGVDYVKASRFYDREALQAMPKYRQYGNIFISLLMKFSSGYYSISDSSNPCGFITRDAIERVDYSIVKKRYDFEASMLIALSIANVKIVDHSVPALYGEETSTINLLPTVLRNLRVVWTGFWRRIFRKYVLFGFHPIALFLYSGTVLLVAGIVLGIWSSIVRIVDDVQPSSGTIMLVALPIILGFQLVLTSLTMDVANENK